MKCHYTPEHYIKQFQYDSNGNVYHIRKEYFGRKTTAKSIGKGGICYEEDRFVIGNDKKVEESFFSYENDLVDIFAPFLKSSVCVSASELKRLVDLIISFKNRNPTFSDYLENIDITISMTPVEKEKAIKKGYSVDELFTYFYGLQKSETYHKEMYLGYLLSKPSKGEKYLPYLLDSKITVLSTTPDNPFISSCTPGFDFSLNGKTKLGNTIPSIDADAFIFPLSPTKVIHFNLKECEPWSSLDKRVVEVVELPSSSVDSINRFTFLTAYKYVFSNSESQLNRISDAYKEKVLATKVRKAG